MAAQYSMIDVHHILHFYLLSNGYSSLLSCINYCCVTNHPKIYWFETWTSYCFSSAYGFAIWFYWDRRAHSSLWSSVDQLGAYWSRKISAGTTQPSFFLLSGHHVSFTFLMVLDRNIMWYLLASLFCSPSWREYIWSLNLKFSVCLRV